MSKKIIENVLKKKTLSQFYGRDFDAIRADLLRYAKIYFPDKIKDFSDASVGGLFLDMAAHVGDTMSFYIDHQFNELNIGTAIETRNIIKLFKSAGVPLRPASPGGVLASFYIEVPAVLDINDNYVPDPSTLPIIQKGTIIKANSGISFTLLDNLDFSKEINDVLIAESVIGNIDVSSNPTSFIMKMSGICVSGDTNTKKFQLGDFEQFKKLTLDKKDITEILSVKDSDGNEYYEVDYLVQDVVFKKVQNNDYDYGTVSENLELLPAPYRFTKEYNTLTGFTTLTFGSGNSSTLDGDYIPDPSDFALPLYGKTAFSRAAIDPKNMLSTSTLGMAPHNTTLTVTYRSGGGLGHNVPANSIKTISTLFIAYNRLSTASINLSIKNSVDVLNDLAAQGGEDKPTLNEMKYEYKGYMNSQSRIVTKSDLLARVYTMPADFGRVFRAGISKISPNPLATQLFILSRDSAGKITHSSDGLKKNLEIYLNEYRLISDAIDILDAFIINIGLEYEIITDGVSNKNIVIQQINSKLKEYFNIKMWQIDQPINKSEIKKIILSNDAVISLVGDISIFNRTGVGSSGDYSNILFDPTANTKNEFVIGPVGSMFELKFPSDDIIGYVK